MLHLTPSCPWRLSAQLQPADPVAMLLLSSGLNQRGALQLSNLFVTSLSLHQRSAHRQLQASSRPMEVLATAEAATPDLQGVRLDEALPSLFPGRFKSPSATKKTVRRGDVLVNGSAATTHQPLQLGDRVQIVTRVGCAAAGAAGRKAAYKQQLHKLLPGLHVAWEDDHMAVIVKPQGLLSQGPKGAASVAGRIKYCLTPTPLPGAMGAPVIAHRLDVGTGGLMMIAKTRPAAAQLAHDLAQHKMQKRYLALVLGHVSGCGMIDHPVGGCPAVSLYRVEGHRQSGSFGCLSLLSLWPKTGRTHQLRKHMAYIGHPILGDLKYKHHRKPECTPTPTAAAHFSILLAQLSTPTQERRSQQQHKQEQQVQLGPLSTAAAAAAGQAGGWQDVQQQLCQDDSSEQQQQQQPQEPQQQQEPQQPQAQHQQQLPLLRVNVPELDLPVFDGQNPHSSSMKAKTSTADAVSSSSSRTDLDQAGEAGCTEAAVSDSMDTAAGGIRQRGEVLQAGTVVGTCLWAVQLQLAHPVTRQLLDIDAAHSVEHLYDRICQLDR